MDEGAGGLAGWLAALWPVDGHHTSAALVRSNIINLLLYYNYHNYHNYDHYYIVIWLF